MINRRAEGRYYEDVAAHILEEIGFQVLERNIYTCVGELDILAKKDGVLHFFEVRFRKTLSAKESLTAFKYERMKRTMSYLIKRERYKLPCKLGFIAIQYASPEQGDGHFGRDDATNDPNYIQKFFFCRDRKHRMEIFLSIVFD